MDFRYRVHSSNNLPNTLRAFVEWETGKICQFDDSVLKEFKELCD